MFRIFILLDELFICVSQLYSKVTKERRTELILQGTSDLLCIHCSSFKRDRVEEILGADNVLILDIYCKLELGFQENLQELDFF